MVDLQENNKDKRKPKAVKVPFFWEVKLPKGSKVKVKFYKRKGQRKQVCRK